ncbi:hypothetical protein MASR1M66_14930 [Aminivibrio sp.]
MFLERGEKEITVTRYENSFLGIEINEESNFIKNYCESVKGKGLFSKGGKKITVTRYENSFLGFDFHEDVNFIKNNCKIREKGKSAFSNGEKKFHLNRYDGVAHGRAKKKDGK